MHGDEAASPEVRSVLPNTQRRTTARITLALDALPGQPVPAYDDTQRRVTTEHCERDRCTRADRALTH